MSTFSVNNKAAALTTAMSSKVMSRTDIPRTYFQRVMGDHWWAKALIGVVLTAEIGFAAGELIQGETSDGRKPAYTLKVIAFGEGTPKSEELSAEGLQQNRRVDVTFQGVPVEIPQNLVAAETRGAIWLTQDPLSVDRRLNITSERSISVPDSSTAVPVRMNINANYASYVSRWEVLFFWSNDVEQSEVVASVTGDQFANESVLEWNGVLNDGSVLTPGDELIYVLRVFDAEGNVDETYPSSLSALGPDRYLELQNESSLDSSQLTDGQVPASASAEATKQRTVLAREEIPIRGSRVRIYGRDLGDIQSVSINGEPVTLDTDKDFAAEYLRDFGTHNFLVTVTGVNGESYSRQLTADLNDQYLFLVGLADFTAGRNQLRGVTSLELGDQERFDGDIFVDGRVALYLKGKVKGKYLVTAQMDTGREDIEELFDGLSRTDNTSVFRRLDPEQYYPVYGDDSTLIDDADSQGKLYLRLDWDQSQALWGNYNTGVTGTELAQFNRSLYGARFQIRSQSYTENGDHTSDLTAFVSEAQSVARHVEFKGTGGSLYYLRDTDIVIGSEKLQIEVRQRDSDRVIDRFELVEGRDYQIDDIQGRIILNRPLRTVGDEIAPSIIKDTPLDGNEIWLIADYEYVPEALSVDDMTAGVRGKQWLGDHIALGGTYVLEKRDGSDHMIKGIDATLARGKSSWLRAEFAQSDSAQTGASFISEDGGLNFTPFNSNTAGSNTDLAIDGDAYSVEAKLDLAEMFTLQRKATVGAWAKYRDGGFAGSGFDTGADTTDKGIEASMRFGEKLELSGRATSLDKDNISKLSTASLQATYDISNRLLLAAELRKIDETDDLANTVGSGTLAALQAGVDISDTLNVYGAVQSTLESDGSYESNDLLTIGAKTQATKKISLNLEASNGERGESLLGGIDYRVSDNYSLYVNQTLSTDRTDTIRNVTTLGQRHNVSSKLRVFTEHQFTDEDQQAGIGHTFGLDYKATDFTNINASVQFANLETESDGTTARDALSVGLGYRRDKTHLSSRLEFRRDMNDTQEKEQWLTANSLNYAFNPSFRWQGKLNFSETTDLQNADSDARFAEAGIGFAYRPVRNSRFNMLARLTHIHDLPPLSQVTAVDERSTVGSMEMAYQLNRLWEVGGKVALKNAEVRTSRDTGVWVDNGATLLASRVRYHLRFRWDALAEYHWLQSDASDDLNHGALVSVGKHVGDNLKFAVGYNFTRFDDSLLNRDADVKGWFVNLVGKY